MHPSMTSELARVHVDDLIRTAGNARRARMSVEGFPSHELDDQRRATGKSRDGAKRGAAIAVLAAGAALLFGGR